MKRETYTFASKIDPAQAVWSRCDVVRDLNVSTRLRVLGGGDQMVDVTRNSGITLMARPCQPVERAPSSPDADRGTIVLAR